MSANRTLGIYTIILSYLELPSFLTYLCVIILSYLEESQKPFLAKWKVDIYRKRRKIFFQLSIQPYVFFGTGPVTSTENLKSLMPKTGLFLSLLSVVFGLLTSKNLPYQISRWKDDYNNSYYRKCKFKMANIQIFKCQ